MKRNYMTNPRLVIRYYLVLIAQSIFHPLEGLPKPDFNHYNDPEIL